MRKFKLLYTLLISVIVLPLSTLCNRETFKGVNGYRENDGSFTPDYCPFNGPCHFNGRFGSFPEKYFSDFPENNKYFDSDGDIWNCNPNNCCDIRVPTPCKGCWCNLDWYMGDNLEVPAGTIWIITNQSLVSCCDYINNNAEDYSHIENNLHAFHEQYPECAPPSPSPSSSPSPSPCPSPSPSP